MKSNPGLFAIIGDDDLKKVESLDSVTKKWLETENPDEMAKEVFYGEKLDIELFMQSYEMISMFASKRILIIKQFDETSTDFQQKFISSIKPDNSEVGVALTMEKLDKRSKIYKYLQNSGHIIECKLPFANQIPPWLSTRCNMKYNRRLSVKDAAYLCECIGDDLQELDWELDKLNTYLPQGKAITAEVIEEVILPHRDVSFFDLQKYFGLNDCSKSLTSVSNILGRGEPGLRIAINLFFHFLKLMRIKKLMEENLSENDIAAKFKMNPYFFKKIRLVEQAGKRTIAEYKKILQKLADLELNLKKGKYPLNFEIEMALTEILQSETENRYEFKY